MSVCRCALTLVTFLLSFFLLLLKLLQAGQLLSYLKGVGGGGEVRVVCVCVRVVWGVREGAGVCDGVVRVQG